MSVTIDNKCLANYSSSQDTTYVLKLFKLACLAYKPSTVEYRGQVMERTEMIQMRRLLIDRLSNILPTSDLFRANAIYPRRYYDDLMISEKGYKAHLETIQSKKDFELTQMQKFQKLSQHDFGLDIASTNLSDKFTSPKSHLLNVGSKNTIDLRKQIAQKLQFGSNKKSAFDLNQESLSKINDKLRNHSLLNIIDETKSGNIGSQNFLPQIA